MFQGRRLASGAAADPSMSAQPGDSSRAPGSSWGADEEDDEDFVVEELADTDEDDDDEASEEGSDSGSGVDYEPESERRRAGSQGVRGAGRRAMRALARCALCAAAPPRVSNAACNHARASTPNLPEQAAGWRRTAMTTRCRGAACSRASTPGCVTAYGRGVPVAAARQQPKCMNA